MGHMSSTSSAVSVVVKIADSETFRYDPNMPYSEVRQNVHNEMRAMTTLSRNCALGNFEDKGHQAAEAGKGKVEIVPRTHGFFASAYEPHGGGRTREIWAEVVEWAGWELHPDLSVVKHVR